MTISIPGRVVVFDYGEVISLTPSEADRAALLAIAQADGVLDPDAFWQSYWAHRHDLDRGTILPDEYWRTIADDTGADWDAARLHELWAADFRSWFSAERPTLELVARLHDGGTRIAILSNAGFDFADPLRHSPLGSWMEQVFISAELDELKPGARIYELVAEGLGIEPAEMVFIDNKVENVAGAEALGITGHHYTGPDGLREFLLGLAGPPVPHGADKTAAVAGRDA